MEESRLSGVFEDDPVFLNVSYKTGRVYQSSNREHFHRNEYEIYYLVTGEKYFYAEGKSYCLRSGDVMFVPPKVCHRSMWPEKGMYSNRTVCLFSRDFIEPALTLAQSEAVQELFGGQARKISLSTVGGSKFEILMRMLNEEMERDDEEYLCVCRMLVLQLCICLLREGVSEAPQGRKSRSETNMETVRTYIDRSFSQELTLNHLASRFFMNPSALSRSFKNATGQTVMNYINQRRMECAKELLEQKNYSVEAVSGKVGFKTATYFERMFKQTTGLTPTQYKNCMKNGG